jgi:AraC-like DNA-binding protein/mannose-6-phosphate isomerase-like protein (cupin superfamily)
MYDQLYHENIQQISRLGIHLAYHTVPGGYHPPHWHEELEILFALNGQSDITVDGTVYHLGHRQMMVIESGLVHSTASSEETYMFVCIHLSKEHLKSYMADIDLYHIDCPPIDINDDRFPEYLNICRMLEDLTRIYMTEPPTASMESEGLILLIYGHLLQHFSTTAIPATTAVDELSKNRLRDVITYVQDHFTEPIALQDVSDLLGLTREYFCRFFKKNMGMSFLEYLMQVRLSHLYHDLTVSDQPISVLMEENGLYNQKLCNNAFKKLYGCTPSAVRNKQDVFPGTP